MRATRIGRGLGAAMLCLIVALSFADPAAGQDDDIPDACRTIIGCADAGPAPENPGDRGGYAQLLTLVVLASGVGFILVKVGLAVRDGDRRTVTRPPD
ncbi:MAG: hypothetical protein RIB98_03450 [Acidimicrobiales bacterium]